MYEIKALSGLQVLNLSYNVPGPVAARRLQSMGASVVKVEPLSGDPLEGYCKAWYEALVTGQIVRRLDLKSDQGQSDFRQMLASSDLLITSLRPSSLARLGLSWEALHADYPALSHVAIVGYPAPEQERPGHDLTYLAETGLLDPPRLPRTLLADIAGGERTASIATALLLGAARGQVASHVQVPLKDAAQALAEPLVYGATKAGNALTGGFAGYNLYAAAQGWVAVAALEESLWAQLTSALGIPETSGIDMLAEVFSSRPAGEWEAWARAHNLPVAAVKQADDMPGQP